MSKERAEQLVEAGIWLRLSGDLEGARRLFEQALTLDPENARAKEMFDGAARSSQGMARPPDAGGNPFARSTPVGTAGGYSPGSSPMPFAPNQVVDLTPSDADLRRMGSPTPSLPPRAGTPTPLKPGELGLDPLTPRAVVLMGDAEPPESRRPLFTPPPVAAAQFPTPAVPGHTVMFGRPPPPSAPDPFPALHAPAPAGPSGGRTMMFGLTESALPLPQAAQGGRHTLTYGEGAEDPDADQTNPYGTYPGPAPPLADALAAQTPRTTLPFGVSPHEAPQAPDPAPDARFPAGPSPGGPPGNFVPWDLPDSGAFGAGAVTAPEPPSPPTSPLQPPSALPRPPTPVPGMRVVAEAPLLTSNPSGPGPRTTNAASALGAAATAKSPSGARPVPGLSTPLPSVAPSIAPIADESPMRVTRSSPSRPPPAGAEATHGARTSPSRPPIADEPPSPMVVTSPSRPPLPLESSPARQHVPRVDPREPIPANRGPIKGVSGVWTAVPDAEPSRPASQPTDDAWNWGNAAAPSEPEPAGLELPMFPSPAPFVSPSPALAQNAESAWDQRSNPGIKLQSRESGAGMDMLARDRKTPAPPPSEPKANVASLLKSARNILELDDHTGAMDLILKAQALAPDSPEVQQMRERSEQTLIAMYESKIGKLETKPRVLLKNDEIIWLNLDHRAGFVLAQIDGTVTFDDLFAVSGMSRFDTAKILAQMIDEGVISRG